MMSHHRNDLAYDQRQDLYWDSYDRLIEEGYPAGMAEDLAMVIVERSIEKSDYIREEQEWDARGE